jgi:glycosyltransferase involved in cell wall biosynthesis
MGTATHHEEYEFLEKVGKQLFSKYKDQITINIIGATTKQFLPTPFRRITPDNPSGTYHGFVGWFVNQNWDIGLAPLMESEFNKCKSAIKLMDYAACGLPIIASLHDEYLKSFNHEHGIRYVENNAESWVNAISLLIDDVKLRHATAQAIHARYFQKHTLKNNINEYQTSIME